jgi:hypothetical protein
MNLIDRDIGKLAAILIGDTVDEHCGNLPYELNIKSNSGTAVRTSSGSPPAIDIVSPSTDSISGLPLPRG